MFKVFNIISRLLTKGTTFVCFSVCISHQSLAESFEMMPGLWQSRTTIIRDGASGDKSEANDTQVNCLDQTQAKGFFVGIEEIYKGLNQSFVLNADYHCTTQNQSLPTLTKLTTTCKQPRFTDEYRSHLLILSFNNQHQFTANIQAQHPDGHFIKMTTKLYYLGRCIDPNNRFPEIEEETP